MRFRPHRVSSVLRVAARRALLGLLTLQVTVIAVLSGIDSWRKRHRSQSAGFPRSAPEPVDVGHDEITLYAYGEDLYADMLDAIRTARHQVLFESFIWKGDEVGTAFKDELIAAAARGVEVYVIFDDFANLVVSERFKRFPPSLQVLRYPMYAAGWRFFDVRRYGRDHRKILVVDDRFGFVGGYNIGSAYATQWRDSHVRIAGPSVWGLRNAFVDFWNLHRESEQPWLPDEGALHWDPHIRVHRNVPRQVVFPIRGMYLEAIDRATHHVYLTHAYFVPDSAILRALLAAARRGVDVRLLMPTTSNHVVADWLSRGFYGTLLRGGVRIFLYRAMVHAKTATVDRQWSTIGTANVDRLSLSGNYEINLEVYDDKLAARMEQVFSTDCGNATELTAQAWDARPFVAKFSETVLAPLRPLL